MARSRRRRQPLPYEVAEGLTGLWFLWLVLTVLLPISALHRTPEAGNMGLLLLGTVPVAQSWWWLLRTVRQPRARGKRLDELIAMSPAAFEDWVGARFRELGYAVEVTGAPETTGLTCLQQAGREGGGAGEEVSRWTVGEPILRDLYGAMHGARADRVYLVTTGRLTEAARSWASGKAIDVWDGDRVVQLSLGTGEQETPASTSPEAAPRPCPRCGAPKVVRVNRRTGRTLFGCSTFPRCRQTIATL